MRVQYPINNVYNNHPSFSGGKINPKNINIEGQPFSISETKQKPFRNLLKVLHHKFFAPKTKLKKFILYLRALISHKRETIALRLRKKQHLKTCDKIAKHTMATVVESKSSRIKFRLGQFQGKTLINQFDTILQESGVKIDSTDCQKAILSDGKCLTKTEKGSYIIEIPADNMKGFEKQIEYDATCNLEKITSVKKNSDSTCNEEILEFKNSDIIYERIKHTHDKKPEMLIYSFQDNKQKIFYMPLLPHHKPSKKYPKGCIMDSKSGKIVKVNPDKITINKNSKGIVRIEDEYNNLLGSIKYVVIHDNTLYFYEFISHSNGLNIGKRLINEIIKIADNREIYAVANFEPSIGGGSLKPSSNLGFYYKMGFRAIDSGIDKLVRQCIKNNFKIPVSINSEVKIIYIGSQVI